MRRPALTPDPVVDISYMFCITLRREDIGSGYFSTCKSHKIDMEQQMYEYQHISGDSGFWVSIIWIHLIRHNKRYKLLSAIL
jgi:hypothetical protein